MNQLSEAIENLSKFGKIVKIEFGMLSTIKPGQFEAYLEQQKTMARFMHGKPTTIFQPENLDHVTPSMIHYRVYLHFHFIKNRKEEHQVNWLSISQTETTLRMEAHAFTLNELAARLKEMNECCVENEVPNPTKVEI